MRMSLKSYALRLSWRLLGWLKQLAAKNASAPLDEKTERDASRYLTEALKNGDYGVQKIAWTSEDK